MMTQISTLPRKKRRQRPACRLMDLERPPADFQFVQLERVNPELGENRFYYLAWLPTLLGWAVVRVWGRKGGAQQMATPATFDSLDEAWATIQGHIATRLLHGYRISKPAEYATAEQDRAGVCAPTESAGPGDEGLGR
jgi:predicted DNA-binding WGR domain protein